MIHPTQHLSGSALSKIGAINGFFRIATGRALRAALRDKKAVAIN
jgi:hypothetical protein